MVFLTPTSLAVLRCDPLTDSRDSFWEGYLRLAIEVFTLPYDEDTNSPPPTYFPLPHPKASGFQGRCFGRGVLIDSDLTSRRVWRELRFPSIRPEPYIRWSFSLFSAERVIVTFHTPIQAIQRLSASIPPYQRKRFVPWNIWSAFSRCIVNSTTGRWAAHGTRHLFYSPLTSAMRIIDFSPGASQGANSTRTRPYHVKMRSWRPFKWNRRPPHHGPSSSIDNGTYASRSYKEAISVSTLSLQEILGGRFRTDFPVHVVEPILELPDLPPCDEVNMECDAENILIYRVSKLSLFFGCCEGLLITTVSPVFS